MYQINNYIIYGMTGVCKVIEVGTLKVSGADSKKLYYTLEPLCEKGSIIYTSVDNDKVAMRNIISKKEALKLVQNIPYMKTIQIPDDKRSEQIYKEALKKNECFELMELLKVLALREHDKSENNKRLSSIDKKYYDLIKDSLIWELSLALEMPCEKIENELLIAFI